MKLRKLFAQLGLAAILLSTLNLQLSTARAQGTAFTYQGRLDLAGTPANGTNDLTFTLFDAVAAGATVGTSNTFNDLVITNGLFTVTLDFGAGAFNGTARWLQIAARPGVSTGAYTNLAPRQSITPAPYAVFAGGAAAAGVTGTLPAGALSGAYSGAVNLSNAANSFAGNGAGLTSLNASNLTSGTVADARLSTNVALRSGGNTFNGNQRFLTNVGIGTVPVAQLDVRGPSTFVGGIALGDYNITNSRYIGIIHPSQPANIAANSGFSGVEFGGPAGNTNSGLLAFHTHNSGSSSSEKMRITKTGYVGIGTTTPGVQLDVAGDGRFSGDLDIAGYVTVGDTNTGSALTLYTASGSYGIFHSDGVRELGTYLDSAGGWFGTRSADPLYFYVADGSPILTINTNGNVGIGTTTPNAKLEVSNGSISLQVIPGYLNGVLNPNAVTLEVPGLSTLGVWDNLNVANGLQVGGDVTVGAGKQIASTGRLHVQSSGGEPLYLNPYVGGTDVIVGGGGGPGTLRVVGEVYCTAINITSDRNAKEQFKPVSGRDVLAKVAALPITEWQYKTQGDARHIGPMAQDFRAAFGTGRDDKHITSVDADGVALAAIQGLHEIVKEKSAEVESLKQSVAELRELVNRLTQPAGR